ncbi:unnamed protein product [Danaus chrysippus]|uniref:(African queen) hypothetical protein n=1 Tax=Danaus chrysippus TaxID=151541 RepID=A0A8J2WF37_9NEOP|nr:unnamed protein product [Danaus chrysippus]
MVARDKLGAKWREDGDKWHRADSSRWSIPPPTTRNNETTPTLMHQAILVFSCVTHECRLSPPVGCLARECERETSRCKLRNSRRWLGEPPAPAPRPPATCEEVTFT